MFLYALAESAMNISLLSRVRVTGAKPRVNTERTRFIPAFPVEKWRISATTVP